MLMLAVPLAGPALLGPLLKTDNNQNQLCVLLQVHSARLSENPSTKIRRNTETRLGWGGTFCPLAMGGDRRFADTSKQKLFTDS